MSHLVVPYVDLVAQHAPVKEQLMAAVSRVLDHGGFVLGEEVAAFERKFAAYCGVKHAIGVANGTDALILSLKAIGVRPGDEVITAANSFLASASAIALAGATPVFADVGEDLNLDAAKVEAAITPRTKAIIAVHLTGRITHMEPLLAVAGRHGLKIIEDAAQAAGARYQGRRAGAFGVTACFSFHPLKTLNACGDGGMIVTDDDQVRDWLLKARNHGLKDRTNCEFWSVNSRLDAIQAAMLAVKLEHFEAWNEGRRTHAAAYRAALADVVEVPGEGPEEFQVYHTFMIRTPRRDALQAHLAAHGIDTRIHYEMPIHRQEAARELEVRPGSLPVTERLCGEILSLPIYAEMTVAQRGAVIDCICGFFKGN